MDWQEVFAHAEGFARAVEERNINLITSYLSEEQETKVIGLLDSCDGPFHESEVLTVNPLESDSLPSNPERWNYFAMVSLSGPEEEIILRTEWRESPQQLLISDACIVNRMPILRLEMMRPEPQRRASA
jgi:hypothetical protein